VTYRLARATGLAWPARDAIQRVVRRAAQECGGSVTSIDEIAWAMPNALALPLGRRVAFTKVAADALTESEVARSGFKILPDVGRIIGTAPCDSLRNLIPKLEPDFQSESTWLLEHCDDAMVHRLAHSSEPCAIEECDTERALGKAVDKRC
jgi:putative intracellular protease/amidase